MKINIDFGNDGVTVEATLSRDGNRWCVLLGSNEQVGICGFGYQTGAAIEDFREKFRNDLASTEEDINSSSKEKN